MQVLTVKNKSTDMVHAVDITTNTWCGIALKPVSKRNFFIEGTPILRDSSEINCKRCAASIKAFERKSRYVFGYVR